MCLFSPQYLPERALLGLVAVEELNETKLLAHHHTLMHQREVDEFEVRWTARYEVAEHESTWTFVDHACALQDAKRSHRPSQVRILLTDLFALPHCMPHRVHKLVQVVAATLDGTKTLKAPLEHFIDPLDRADRRRIEFRFRKFGLEIF